MRSSMLHSDALEKNWIWLVTSKTGRRNWFPRFMGNRKFSQMVIISMQIYAWKVKYEFQSWPPTRSNTFHGSTDRDCSNCLTRFARRRNAVTFENSNLRLGCSKKLRFGILWNVRSDGGVVDEKQEKESLKWKNAGRILRNWVVF